MRSAELFSDDWVCVASADGGLPAGDTLTFDDLKDASWVVPFYRNQNSPLAPPAIRQLSMLGFRPRVAIGVESYLAVPPLIAGTGRVALLQRRLATLFENQLNLRVWPCPGDPEPIVEVLWWHEDLDDDPGHEWLRASLAELASKL
jgi:DNA-binding transcriptional LysR family regulator